MNDKLDTRRRNAYSDEFVAGALMILSSNGHPEVYGALNKTCKQLGVSLNTLKSWYKKTGRNKHEVKSFDYLKRELAHTWEESARVLHTQGMRDREDLSAMQAFTAAAISTDKLDNLTKGPQVSIRVHVTGTMGDAATPWVNAGEIVDAAVREVPALESGVDDNDGKVV